MTRDELLSAINALLRERRRHQIAGNVAAVEEGMERLDALRPQYPAALKRHAHEVSRPASLPAVLWPVAGQR